jgi:hypothetical protein
MMRIHVSFRTPTGSKVSKVSAILLGLLALAAMLFFLLGAWLVLSATVVLITSYTFVRTLYRRRDISKRLPNANGYLRNLSPGRTKAVRPIGKLPPSNPHGEV